MANIYNNQRISFAKSITKPKYPDLLEIQIKSYKNFVQLDTPAHRRADEGLHRVFVENFPVTDARENFLLEFRDYSLEPPRYEIEECKERGLTYAVALKAKLFLKCTDKENEDFDSVEQEVFLGNIPYMTPGGTFIINGAERVIVSQLHRSPGVFFGQSLHPNGTKLYSARIIPFKGSWIEFSTDVNNIMYAYIDGKKKFPITTLLRAIDEKYSTDKGILDIFRLAEEVEVTRENLERIAQESKTNGPRRLAARVLKSWVEDFVDEETGEVINITRNEVIMERDEAILDASNEENAEKVEEQIEQILDSGQKSIILLSDNTSANDYAIILNTLQKDNCNSQLEAMQMIYRQLRNAEAPDEETARGIIDKLFFSDKRYDLGQVGRYRLNKKLHEHKEGTEEQISDEDKNRQVLSQIDIIEIVKYLILLQSTKASVDDIDHLSNRRVRTVGEQLYAQFSVGLARMARTIRERMNIRDNELFTPQDLINARTLSSVINTFFGTSQLSQFMDQTNPLSEITHKRRISALGPGGLSREHAGFEVRDVHYSHYGRLCPIETPEGPNIGLISSLCIYAQVNDMGFIETPYWEVLKVDENGNEVPDLVYDKDGNLTDDRVMDGVVKIDKFKYRSAEQEDNKTIAQSNAQIDKDGRFKVERVKSRNQGDFPVVEPKQLDWMDIAPNQIVSLAASLIPFLEHDDANRALMGSNMQRQAVPLLKADSPIVGTGMELKAAADSRTLIIAERDGVVDFVDANKIRVLYDYPTNRSGEAENMSFEGRLREYELPKFRRTNQSTCINLTPIVKTGQKLKKGDVLVEGYSTEDGELALGRNLLVAFMPWQGYNFEDAIVISEKVVADDYFTSVNIEEFELQVRDTKLGPEELTREIPNVSEEATKNLDQDGLIRIGAEVREGDILIGKITPKGETDPTPEEKLLRAIFGDKAGDVKDASLKAPPSFRGVVIGNKLFSKDKKDGRTKSDKPMDLKSLEKRLEKIEADMNDLGEDLWESLKNILGTDHKLVGGVYDKYSEELLPPGQALSDRIAHKTFVNYLPYDWNKDWKLEKELKRQLREAQESAQNELDSGKKKTLLEEAERLKAEIRAYELAYAGDLVQEKELQQKIDAALTKAVRAENKAVDPKHKAEADALRESAKLLREEAKAYEAALNQLRETYPGEAKKLDDRISKRVNDYLGRYRELAEKYKQLALDYSPLLEKRDKKDDGTTGVYDYLEKAERRLEGLNFSMWRKLVRLIGDLRLDGITDVDGKTVLPKGKKLSDGVTHKHFINYVLDNWIDESALEGADLELDDLQAQIDQLFQYYKNEYNEIDGYYKRLIHQNSVGDELSTGVAKLAKVYVANKRKLKVGDKMAGRHGNKGIVAKIVRQEDMPFLEDGTPVDIVLNPLGVPSRMNLGQIYETVLGWAGKKLGVKFATPIFDGARAAEVNEKLRAAGLPKNGHVQLYDGQSGEKFHQPTTVGVIYMLKLSHMVDDKMHARSIGPYSLITQQPLGGKAQFGGQRFGEMEVWALEAFGAAHILRELLTVKSDDVVGRAKTYETIVKGDNIPDPGVPESFNVLIHELRGLALEITLD